MRMTFGKHRGEELGSIPHDYLLWVLENASACSPYLREEIKRVLGIHDSPKNEKPLTVNIVNEWFQKMTFQYHPDRGGSNDGMAAVNRGRELLIELVGLK